ncbi:hypothetical protein DL764_002496 [Monosporascus ibericus]|uniref:Uncharacterized protein n=1 Tax=Monosporascus ibericus TaxID=155417 RepID=A0A4V1XBU7_9PEZI|nr:hypothetical protein DL764_002496 [Monosporascus ibericus]
MDGRVEAHGEPRALGHRLQVPLRVRVPGAPVGAEEEQGKEAPSGSVATIGDRVLVSLAPPLERALSFFSWRYYMQEKELRPPPPPPLRTLPN